MESASLCFKRSVLNFSLVSPYSNRVRAKVVIVLFVISVCRVRGRYDIECI
jgi:hypothetical protein